ncbi:hypothetical protein E1264_31785 [Actinomadura sp. KC216]|nr:hypothetical protein E1264_31785 [Actinomadura sp. KC216]
MFASLMTADRALEVFQPGEALRDPTRCHIAEEFSQVGDRQATRLAFGAQPRADPLFLGHCRCTSPRDIRWTAGIRPHP